MLRLAPGADLRAALARRASRPGSPPLMLVAGLGSLDGARLRPAGRDDTLELTGDLEIIAASGTLARAGVHVHLAVADADGRVRGGHLLTGCRVRTTAELLLEALPGLRLTRPVDPRTGYRELRASPAPDGSPRPRRSRDRTRSRRR